MINSPFALIRERASELGKRVGDTGIESSSFERLRRVRAISRYPMRPAEPASGALMS